MHLFIHLQCCNNTYMYTISHLTISFFFKITSGQNGDLAVIWILSVHTLITCLRLSILNICVLGWEPPTRKNILPPLDRTSFKNEARYPTFCKNQRWPLTLSFRPLKPFYLDRVLGTWSVDLGECFPTGPIKIEANRSQSFLARNTTCQLTLLLAINLKRQRQILVLKLRKY